MILVDRCPVIHAGVEAACRNSDWKLEFATTSVRQARQWLTRNTADIVVCDFELADGTAADLQKIANRLEIPLVLFSAWQNPVYVARMMEAGARGLIAKSETLENLLTTLHKVRRGQQLWNRQDIRRMTGALATSRLDSDIDFPLTQREFEVLREMARGQTNKMVADSLGISYETVKEHMQHVLAKLGVKDRTQAAVMAVRRGLL
jgi:DNA-binding NarL/FixJ family response regulator